MDQNLIQKIATHVQIFSGMPRQSLLNTLACANSWAVKKGDPFFQEGDMSSSFFILLSGEATVEQLRNGSVVTLATVKPGECFGEMGLVEGNPRSATVRALTDVASLRFSKEKLNRIPESAAYVYQNISKVLISRLNERNRLYGELQAELAKLKK